MNEISKVLIVAWSDYSLQSYLPLNAKINVVCLKNCLFSLRFSDKFEFGPDYIICFFCLFFFLTEL